MENYNPPHLDLISKFIYKVNIYSSDSLDSCFDLYRVLSILGKILSFPFDVCNESHFRPILLRVFSVLLHVDAFTSTILLRIWT